MPSRSPSPTDPPEPHVACKLSPTELTSKTLTREGKQERERRFQEEIAADQSENSDDEPFIPQTATPKPKPEKRKRTSDDFAPADDAAPTKKAKANTPPSSPSQLAKRKIIPPTSKKSVSKRIMAKDPFVQEDNMKLREPLAPLPIDINTQPAPAAFTYQKPNKANKENIDPQQDSSLLESIPPPQPLAPPTEFFSKGRPSLNLTAEELNAGAEEWCMTHSITKKCVDMTDKKRESIIHPAIKIAQGNQQQAIMKGCPSEYTRFQKEQGKLPSFSAKMKLVEKMLTIRSVYVTARQKWLEIFGLPQEAEDTWEQILEKSVEKRARAAKRAALRKKQEAEERVRLEELEQKKNNKARREGHVTETKRRCNEWRNEECKRIRAEQKVQSQSRASKRSRDETEEPVGEQSKRQETTHNRTQNSNVLPPYSSVGPLPRILDEKTEARNFARLKANLKATKDHVSGFRSAIAIWYANQDGTMTADRLQKELKLRNPHEVKDPQPHTSKETICEETASGKPSESVVEKALPVEKPLPAIGVPDDDVNIKPLNSLFSGSRKGREAVADRDERNRVERRKMPEALIASEEREAKIAEAHHRKNGIAYVKAWRQWYAFQQKNAPPPPPEAPPAARRQDPKESIVKELAAYEEEQRNENAPSQIQHHLTAALAFDGQATQITPAYPLSHFMLQQQYHQTGYQPLWTTFHPSHIDLGDIN